jgi:hypothetical protein
MIPRRVMLSCTYFLGLFLVSCPRANAQFTSAIEGTVTDPTGAVVPGASVTLKNEETGATQTVQTQDSGNYRFTALPSAVFTLTAKSSGFKTTIQAHIRVEVAETKTVNLALTVGGPDSVVTVTSEAPAIETSQGRVSGEIDETRVHELPLSGRNFYTLVVLTPGVTGLASGGGQAYAQASGDIFNPEFGINLNANGARNESNSFLIDSASIDSSQRNGVTNVNPNAEDVQEVRVSTNNFSAEYGRNSAALVNIITKQGTNNWHGSLGYYHTDNKLQARNEFQQKVPVFRRNEGAWSFGGPILKERTFFFASMDFLKSGVAFGRDASVATPDFINFMEQNKPSNISTFIFKSFPSSVTPTKNFVTAGKMAGVDCATLASPSATIPTEVGNVPCNLNVTGVGSFATGLPRNGFQWTVRLDHNFREGKDRLFASVNRTTLHQVLFGNPSVYPGFNTIEPTYSIHFATGWVHATSSGLVNEFGFATTRPYGEALVNHPEVPGITVLGIEGFQTGWGPNAFVQNNFEWRDVAAFTRGSHSLKVGGRVSRERADHESSRVYNRPQFTFASVLDFGADKPTDEGNIGFNPVTGQHLSKLFSLIRTGSLSLFVQDDWKLKRNFTLNLGFRYESFFNPSDAQGAQGICSMTFPNGTNPDLAKQIASGVMKCQRHLLNHTMHNYSPRISFAWDPTKQGRMSVRAGFGIFYDRPSNQLFDPGFSNTPRVALAEANVNNPTFQPLFALGATPDPPYNYPFPAGLQTGLDPNGGLLHGRANVVVVDPNLKTMYLQNWFLGVQRSITPSLTAELDYIGSGGRHLYTRYNLNRFDGDLIRHGGNFTGLQPGFFDIDYAQATESSAYHGLTAAIKKRAGHGVVFDASYTFSKAIDQSSKHDATEHIEAYGDRRERGRADFDVRNRLAFTTLWTLPSPRGNLRNKVFGGWELTNVTILQSGQPFSVICTRPFKAVLGPTGNVIGNTGCDYNADGVAIDQPNTPSFGNSKTGLSRSDYINGIFTAADFPAPPLGQQGNLGRNTYRGPGFANTDFSVIKNIHIPWFLGSEGAKLQFRTEFFNVFNRVNLVNPSQNGTNDLANAQFGKAVSTFPARDIQFALRISF